MSDSSLETGDATDAPTALYRAYRPKSFAEVAAQPEITGAVAAAIKAGHPHHAYLLTGPRGTGKTTTARLIAAGLNCQQGPTDTPCWECESCLTIQSGSALDVLEMDAASHNSVDDIRSLRERTSIAPAFGRFRVFILDEAHMLSNSAWNALLKTLEEPPAGTVFILCTTEAKKVPGTVVSRTQQLRFRAPTAEQAAAVIRRVADAEELTIDDEAVQLLSRAARGSFRDALGLLESARVQAGAQQTVTVELVRALLGRGGEQLLFRMVAAIGQGDLAKALGAASLLASEHDADVLLRELEALARDVLVVSAIKKVPPSLQSTPERDELLRASANALGADGAARLLDEVGWAMMAVRAGADARIRLELCAAKAADPSLCPPADAQTARRLDRLEAQVMSKGASRRPVN